MYGHAHSVFSTRLHKPMYKVHRVESLHQRSQNRSLIDSYNFKDSGLVKKTVAVRIDSSFLRLVSCYRASDIVAGKLRAPSTDWDWVGMNARAEICSATADGVCSSVDRSPSTNLLGANTSVVSTILTVHKIHSSTQNMRCCHIVTPIPMPAILLLGTISTNTAETRAMDIV